jgi:ABC-2 type transport system ATP-binding protein
MGKGVAIRCKNIVKRFAGKNVLNELSVEIQKGEIFGIIGMSGAGKTTFLNALIGYYQIEDGDISYATDNTMMSMMDNRMAIRHIFGFAPQQPSFYPKLTVAENLAYFGVMYNLSRSVINNNTDQLLQLTQLSEHKHKLAQNLSFGMQKRLGISCSIMHKPKVLILDEPTADLDPILRREVWSLVKKINRLGTTVILASHLFDEVESVCDRVGILHNGKIVKAAPVAQLKKLISSESEVIVQTQSGDYRQLLKKLNKRSLRINKIEPKGSKLCIETKDSEKTVVAVLRTVRRMHDKVSDIQISGPSLEEVFRQINKKR